MTNLESLWYLKKVGDPELAKKALELAIEDFKKPPKKIYNFQKKKKPSEALSLGEGI